MPLASRTSVNLDPTAQPFTSRVYQSETRSTLAEYSFVVCDAWSSAKAPRPKSSAFLSYNTGTESEGWVLLRQRGPHRGAPKVRAYPLYFRFNIITISFHAFRSFRPGTVDLRQTCRRPFSLIPTTFKKPCNTTLKLQVQQFVAARTRHHISIAVAYWWHHTRWHAL